MPLLDIDTQGAFKFAETFPDSNFIAILPPNYESLAERLSKRGTETEKSLAIRTKNAENEIALLIEKRDIFTYRVINDDLEKSNHVMETLTKALYSREIKQYL